jgi:hypothetical protein
MRRNVLIVLTLAIAGCTANTQPAYSCSTSGSCIDFVAGFSLEEASHGCSGGLSTTPCPATNRVGRCELTNPDGHAFVQSYYSPTFDAALAQATCGNTAAPLTGWNFSFVGN